MAKKIPQHMMPKMLYELELDNPSVGHRTVYIFCTQRNEAGVVALYRSRHPSDKSRFVYLFERPGGELIVE
jgi:hypothetical protein